MKSKIQLSEKYYITLDLSVIFYQKLQVQYIVRRIRCIEFQLSSERNNVPLKTVFTKKARLLNKITINFKFM